MTMANLPSKSKSAAKATSGAWSSVVVLHSLLLLSLFIPSSMGCTNVLVTPSASADGGPMVAYNADSVKLKGMLYHYPASSGNEGTTAMRKIYDWDSGVYHGEIPEVNRTYNVVGNVNEHGLCIAETTFGGVPILGPKHQPDGILDYGSLIYVTLQRSRNAREAIRTMSSLLDEYGYASSGESFSLADRDGEVWYMELIGRGDSGRRGAAWVARRVPDGYVASHANQARITTFPRDDPENCMFSDDVVELAVQMGLYKRGDDGDDTNFSFSDVYDPLTFIGVRAGEARVWSVFSAIAQDESFEQTYVGYAKGKNLSRRMPLWIKPKSRLNLQNVMDAMASHFEGTALEFETDVGAGLHSAPYRPRPLVWKDKDTQYHNERAIATQQTGWNFVAQIRTSMPRELSALLWFAVDDSSTTPRYPVYGCSTRVSDAYGGRGRQDGVQEDILSFDLTKAFWVQNMVSHLAYSRWSDVYPLVWDRIVDVQERFVREVELIDKEAVDLYYGEKKDEDDDDVAEAVEHVTYFSVMAGDLLHSEWLRFYGELFARFRDFYEITPSADGRDFVVKQTGMSGAWKDRIVKETGKHYEVPNATVDLSLHGDGDATEWKRQAL